MTSPTAPESVCATCKGERRIYSTTLGDLSTRLCPDCVGTGRRSAPESVDVAYPTYCSYCCEPGKERVDSDDHDRVVAALAARLSSEREELRRSEDERRRMEARLASVEKAVNELLASETSVPAPYCGNPMDPVNDLRIVSGRRIGKLRALHAMATRGTE
jgi:NMD protein affecting ribosome stability and mRNA decay